MYRFSAVKKPATSQQSVIALQQCSGSRAGSCFCNLLSPLLAGGAAAGRLSIAVESAFIAARLEQSFAIVCCSVSSLSRALERRMPAGWLVPTIVMAVIIIQMDAYYYQPTCQL